MSSGPHRDGSADRLLRAAKCPRPRADCGLLSILGILAESREFGRPLPARGSCRCLERDDQNRVERVIAYINPAPG
jgi:hypothetical protein